MTAPPGKKEWVTIDSAPKDGTDFLAYARKPRIGGDAMGVAFWYDIGAPHWVWSYVFEPTHWMLLPSPPSEAE